MSADIQKEAVFDDRIVQSRPRYAVEKGALSLTNAPFNAIAATSSQMTFNVYVPSENVFVDRAVRWSATGRFQMTVTPGSNAAGGAPILIPGQDFAVSSFPLNYLCQTMTATINDTTAVINSQDVLMEVLRLTDYKKNLLQRTCPTMLDKYQANVLGVNAVNNPLSGYADAVNDDIVPNGAFNGFFFTDNTGSPLVGSSATAAFTGAGYGMANGVPIWLATPDPPTAPVTLYFGVTSTEKLVLSPFVFADDCESDTGLFGINNIQLVMNFKSAGASGSLRVLKTLGNQGTNNPISNVVFNNGASGGCWASPTLNVQFLTPSLDVPLPPKSVVPYMEFPRYITQSQNGPIQAYNTPGYVAQLQSQTITLPQIPDLLIVYVKAAQIAGGTPGLLDPQDPAFCDAYLPIASQFNSSVKNPLSINFDNFSGLLSSHTTEELYQMSVANGLEMEWNQWSGLARSPGAIPVTTAAPLVGTFPGYASGSLRPLSGGFLVLKPSKDITLQSGQAPSLVGNFTLQFNLQVVNTYPFAVQPTLYVITANSGFFESIRGSSRIIKGVLSEQDIISAPVASAQTHEGLKRLVGGKISFGSMANVYNKAKEIYEKTKPIVSAIKNALPGEGYAGKAKGALGAVGYGTGAGKKSLGLSARVM